MDQEQNIQAQPEKDKPTKVDCEAFFSNLTIQEVSRVVEIERLPTKEEVIKAASNPFEVIIIQTEDGATYASKGEERDIKFEEVRKQIGDRRILLIGHTHPFEEEGSREKSLFYSSLPSAEDLTSKGGGVDRQYIFNTFGRVTFSPIENLGPQAVDKEGAKSISQSMINIGMRDAAKEARQQGIKEIPQIINYLGNYLGKKFGAEFKFESWDEVNEPFSSS